jgi:hypothetical protein
MLSAYMGEAKHELAPPAVEGRSKIVSKDQMDTVEWMMPSLMRMFASSDDVIKFEPETQQDEQAVKDATDYVSYLFWRKNPGFRTLHDAIKNALIQRQAVVKVYCDETTDERTERYHGLSQLDIEALSGDPEIEVVSKTPHGEQQGDPSQQQPDPSGQMQPQMEPMFDVVCKRRTPARKMKVVGVPPEEIRINKAARTIEDARFVQQRTMKSISDLRSLGYDDDKLKKLPSDPGDRQWTYENAERGAYDHTLSDAAQARMDDALREIELCESYIKVDYDGDGIAEYRKVIHAGQAIFENEETDDHPFALACPILMPFKAVGLGMWDLCEDIQRIRTVLTRQMLDNAYLANNPRTVTVEGQVNLDDLLNPRVGGLIRAKSLDAMRTEITPFIGTNVLTMLDHFGQVRDKRTGVTEFNQGLGADSLSKTEVGSEGAQAMMDAAMQRVELIARVLGETFITRIWKLLLKGASQYTDRAQQVRVNGRWLHVDPREWKDDYETVVSIGTGTANARQKVQNLTMLGNIQREAMQAGLCGPIQIYNTVSKLTEAMGYRESDEFFIKPQSNDMPQQPDPEQAKAQAAMQIEQARGQTQMQVAQANAQADVAKEQAKQQFMSANTQHLNELEAQRDQIKLQNDLDLAKFKEQSAMQLEMHKSQMAQETAIAVARINAEAKILSAKAIGAKDASTADSDAAYQEARE